MSFMDELVSKSNNTSLEKAKEVLEYVTPKLIQSAEEGYRGYRIDIDKDELHLYSNKSFVEYLNNNLGGVEVKYVKHFRESPLLKGYGSYEYYLTFTW